MRKLVLSVAAFYGVIAAVNAFSSGGPAGNTGSPFDGGTCASCHASGPGSNGSVTITTNVPEEGYTPGETYTITVNGSSETSHKYGFQAAFQDPTGRVLGEMDASGLSGTRFSGSGNKDYITHNSPMDSTVGEWTFEWTAPTANTGDATVYAVLVAADGASGSGGDDVFTTNLTLNEKEEEVISSIQSSTDKKLKVYPQVVDQSFFVENAEGKSFNLFSVNGQLVNSGIIVSDREELSIDVQAGTYILWVEGESTKLIKR